MGDLRWHWRNLRDFTLLVGFRPLHWRITGGAYSDVLGGYAFVQIGPFTFTFNFDHGDSNWLIGMSELQAESNAYAWEGRDDG